VTHGPESNSPYEVVVVGGGPAGAALATLLQRDGHRCLVFEHSKFPRYHIGESLIPHTYGVLDRLGLLPALRASHFPAKHSVRFVSPSGAQSDPFYFSEVLEGDQARTWQVERSEFDQMCLDNARDSGVEVRMATRVSNVLFDNGRAVGVRAQPTGGKPYEVATRVVVDASGRATVIGSQLGLKGPVPGLEKASYWSYYRGGQRGTGIDAGETTIYVIAERGWFWYIPLPNDIVSVGIVASPDYLFAATDKIDDMFAREVMACRPLSDRLASAERVAAIRGTRQLAYQNRDTCGDGWVMVGDARAFLDPIYSSGLYLALASAELAADCVHEALEAGDPSAARLGAFEPTLQSGLGVIQRLIYTFYDQDFSFREFVRRFPDQRAALIDCLVGDVVGKDMTSFLDALEQMVTSPQAVVN
jgi:flavin-dependent dehydrogenase